MTEFRKWPKSNARQIIDYANVVALIGVKRFVCLDEGVLAICRYLLNTRGTYRTTYAIERDDVGYRIPSEAEFEIITEAIAEGNIDMASCEDISTKLGMIADALGGLSGGSGCGCIGDGSTDVTEVNDNPTEDIPTPSDPVPPGFTDRADYDTYRCQAANWIYDQYTGTLRNWAGLFGTVGGLTLAVITGLLLLTVPPLGLIVIMGALGTLAGIDLGLLFELSDCAARMDETRDDIVCALYNADTTEGAKTALANAAYAALQTNGTTPLVTFKLITDNLISNLQCEALFTKVAAIDGYSGDTDCDNCAGFGDLIMTAPFGSCEASYVSGSFSGTFVVRSCASLVFGSQRSNILMQSTIPLTAVRLTAPSLTEGPDRTFVLDYTDPDNVPQSVNLTQILDFPDPLDCIAFHLTAGTPGDTDSFDLQLTVAEL